MPALADSSSQPWLERFEQVRLIRSGPCFQRYAALDVATGRPRLVIVGASAAPAVEVGRRLDEAARVLSLIDCPRVPAVDTRGRVGEIEYLSLCCDVYDDFASVLEHIAASGIRLAMGATSGLSDCFLAVLAAAHAAVDPNTGDSVCMGGFSWANVLLSENGEPWFVGWGDDLLVAHPDHSGQLVVAPEVMLGARPTRGGDLWAMVTLFRALFALRKLPASLERVLKGHPQPGDESLHELIAKIHGRVLVPPEQRTQDARELHQGYREMWTMIGVEPSLDELRVALLAGRRRRTSTSESGDGGDFGRGRYRIVRELGSGSTSVVYLARDRQLGVEVALKCLHGDAHPRMFARFLREARLLRSIAHRHVVRGFDAEVHDGRVVLVMEYVPGPSLRDWARGATAAAKTLLLGQVATALAALHEVGVVHGDLNPRNVIVSPERGAVVVDLGGAREVDLVRSQSLAPGTLGYLAPERQQGGACTPAGDVYGLAVTAIEILAGTRCPEAILRQLDGLEVDRELCATLRAALDPDPAARPAAARVAELLRPRPVADLRRLTVEPLGRRFRVGGGEPVSLERRHAARRILWGLVQTALSAEPTPLTTRDLLAIGWPGEIVEAESGAHRVHVALATLRKLGLGAHLVHGEVGYRLTGMVDVDLLEP